MAGNRRGYMNQSLLNAHKIMKKFLRKGSDVNPGRDPALERYLLSRRVSVANENPTRHMPRSLLLSGSFGSPSVVSSAVALNDLDWEPDVRPVRSSLPHIGFSARNQDWNR